MYPIGVHGYTLLRKQVLRDCRRGRGKTSFLPHKSVFAPIFYDFVAPARHIHSLFSLWSRKDGLCADSNQPQRGDLRLLRPGDSFVSMPAVAEIQQPHRGCGMERVLCFTSSLRLGIWRGTFPLPLTPLRCSWLVVPSFLMGRSGTPFLALFFGLSCRAPRFSSGPGLTGFPRCRPRHHLLDWAYVLD